MKCEDWATEDRLDADTQSNNAMDICGVDHANGGQWTGAQTGMPQVRLTTMERGGLTDNGFGGTTKARRKKMEACVRPTRGKVRERGPGVSTVVTSDTLQLIAESRARVHVKEVAKVETVSATPNIIVEKASVVMVTRGANDDVRVQAVKEEEWTYRLLREIATPVVKRVT